MLKLFLELKAVGKITEATLVGRNLFNRHPGNTEIFNEYYAYLCMLAETLPSIDDKQMFAEQASVALAFYSENVEINENVVSEIAAHQERLTRVLTQIRAIIDAKEAEAVKAIEEKNAGELTKLFTLKNKLYQVATQEEFDALLLEISATDAAIDKEYLTQEQASVYEALTKEHTELISQTMQEIERKKMVAYNKTAADAFAKAFTMFRENENKYKNQTQLYAMASTTLFAFDASKLFNETLIYYNHVYSYIFSKLDDDGKLALTRFSIECERKLR